MKIHSNIGENKAKCGAEPRSRWSFLATTDDATKVTCRNCSGIRRVSDFPRDTRGAEIKKILKEAFPGSINSVRVDKYSMGESFNVYTSALNNLDEETRKLRMREINSMLANYHKVDRDQWGEILSGGNTYLFLHSLENPNTIYPY